MALADPTTRPAEPPPDLSKYAVSYHLPFGHKVDFDHLSSLHVRACINGGPPLNFLVDTGSVGMIVGADRVTSIDPNAPTGSILYTSSGVELDGVWTKATITFPDSKDARGRVASATIPILAATERKIIPGAVNGGSARPTTNPGVYMMGVGFGRGKDAHPERNPFLNLTDMRSGDVRRGYAITRDGFTLGLTPATTEGFVYQKLTRRPPSADAETDVPRDWTTAPGRITIDGRPQPPAAVLIDTGLTNMMIGMPGRTEQIDVPDGTPIQVDLLDGRCRYEFKVGDKSNPLTPRRVTFVKPSIAAPTLNTGLRALHSFDYLYDADGGYLALRPTSRP